MAGGSLGQVQGAVAIVEKAGHPRFVGAGRRGGRYGPGATGRRSSAGLQGTSLNPGPATASTSPTDHRLRVVALAGPSPSAQGGSGDPQTWPVRGCVPSRLEGQRLRSLGGSGCGTQHMPALSGRDGLVPQVLEEAPARRPGQTAQGKDCLLGRDPRPRSLDVDLAQASGGQVLGGHGARHVAPTHAGAKQPQLGAEVGHAPGSARSGRRSRGSGRAVGLDDLHRSARVSHRSGPFMPGRGSVGAATVTISTLRRRADGNPFGRTGRMPASTMRQRPSRTSSATAPSAST